MFRRNIAAKLNKFLITVSKLYNYYFFITYWLVEILKILFKNNHILNCPDVSFYKFLHYVNKIPVRLSTLHKTKEDIEAEMLLIKQAQTDPARFGPLYERYYKPVFLFVYRRTDDEDLTADLTSQVFLKAITYLPRYEYKGLPFSAWLFRIAVNEINMFFRKHKNRRSLSIEDGAMERIAEEWGEDEKEEKMEELLKGIQSLALEEVQYIELRFFEERSFKEIAVIMDITENNAKVRTYRILDKIKKLIRI